MENDVYEIQHFDFSAAQVSIERKYFLQKILSTALKNMVEKLSASPETLELLMKQKEEVSQLMMKTIEPSLEEAADLDRKNFSIPKHVLLAPDFEQIKHYTEMDEREVDEQLTTLKQQFLENSVMLAALKMENEQYSSIEPYVQDELKVHSEVLKIFQSDGWKKLRLLVDETKDIMKL